MSVLISDRQAKKNISRNVRRILADMELSQADLARMVDESPMRVSLLVRGEKLASAAFLARIAKGLGTTADYLLTSSRKT